MITHNLFYFPYASFTKEQLPLFKVAALYFDKLVILDPVGASWATLLQGDVSNDLVEDAFLTYLRKLEELARLDIVAMHLKDKADPAQNTLHVIGRTHGEPHKYFYRRYAHQMWTPWEPVTAEIEGDHLAPVVWRDRLYLFWITFLEKPKQTGGEARNIKPGDSVSVAAAESELEARVTHPCLPRRLPVPDLVPFSIPLTLLTSSADPDRNPKPDADSRRVRGRHGTATSRLSRDLE